MTQYDALYLSPHLDDVVLSCGGRINKQTSRGLTVGILTVFTGDLDDSLNDSFARLYTEAMNLKPSEAMPFRRSEDLEACRKLGAEPIHWDFVEATGRHTKLRSVNALFKDPPAGDGSLIDALAVQLRDFEGSPEIIAPLGIGGHMDHVVVRRAAELAKPRNLLFYEDFPYVHHCRKRECTARSAGLTPRVAELAPVDISARIDAIQAYGSQIGPLFATRYLKPKSWPDMPGQVITYVQEVGGERYWRASWT